MLSLLFTPWCETLIISYSSLVGSSHITTGIGFRRRWGTEQRCWITKFTEIMSGTITENQLWRNNDKRYSSWVTKNDSWEAAACSHVCAVGTKPKIHTLNYTLSSFRNQYGTCDKFNKTTRVYNHASSPFFELNANMFPMIMLKRWCYAGVMFTILTIPQWFSMLAC